MPPPVSGDICETVRSIFAERSLADRIRGRDHRPDCLARLAASGDCRVVPDLLSLLAADDALTPQAAGTVAGLLRHVTPAQLAWIDEQARVADEWQAWRSAWRGLTPDTVARLAHAAALETAAIGVLASHRSGFVRAAAVEALGQRGDGRELPFLALRVNDWVEPVAARARHLLLDRLRPDNRAAVLDALPFLVRLRDQRRRDHADLDRALATVLSSDGGVAALARVRTFVAGVRRFVYARLLDAASPLAPSILDAAMCDPDAVIRSDALRALAAAAPLERQIATLERLLRDDSVASVRRLALTLLSEQQPDRVSGLFPEVLLDPAPTVRHLARFLARALDLPVVPADVYRRGLGSAIPREVTAAIDGLGEIGATEATPLVAAHLDSRLARRRRAALRALARLDPARAVPAALAALADAASGVRSAAMDVLGARRANVDFAQVGRRIRSLPDARVRRDLLRVLARAPKWEAIDGLLDAVGDVDAGVRARAVHYLDRWVEAFNRSQIAPTEDQRRRIVERLDSVAPSLPVATARDLRFVTARV